MALPTERESPLEGGVGAARVYGAECASERNLEIQ